MKYDIRFSPAAPGIESALWRVWRPGERDLPMGALRRFAAAKTLAEAMDIVADDIGRACLKFGYYDSPTPKQARVAVAWWTYKHRDDWRNGWRWENSVASRANPVSH